MAEKDAAEQVAESDNSSYLHEPFITEDGIEVPPPTRPMGPRRLTRYREEATAFYRALAAGEELPAEPIAYMPIPEGVELPASWFEEKSAPEEEVLAAEQTSSSLRHRFTQLAEQGEISTETAESGKSIFDAAGKDTRDDVSVTNFVATKTAAEAEPADEGTAADLTVRGDFVEGELPADSGAEALEATEPLESSEAGAENEVATSGESAPADSSAALPAEIETVESEAELPEPVRAIDAQGLDLSSLETEIADEVEEKKPWSHEEVEELPTINESASSILTESPFEQPDSEEYKAAEAALVQAEVAETPKKNLWIGVVFLILVVVLILVWLRFFQ